MSKIAVAITGSIAAYKACDLVRELWHRKDSVHVLLTPNALRFVTPLTLSVLSGNPVAWEEFPSEAARGAFEAGMPHIQSRQDLDFFIVAPATAGTIAKMAHGIADNLLTSAYLALDRDRTRVLVCPAMNPAMYSHPATQTNLGILRANGAQIVEPQDGLVACGDEGYGKLATVAEILRVVDARRPGPLGFV